MAMPAYKCEEELLYTDSSHPRVEFPTWELPAPPENLYWNAPHPEPSQVENLMVNVELETSAGVESRLYSFHVSVETYGTGADAEVLACIPESRALCGFGATVESAIDDLLDGLFHDLKTLSEDGEAQLTKDASDHLAFIHTLVERR